MSYLTIKNLSKTYKKSSGFLNTKTFNIKALDNISFSVKKGSCMAIVGESGSGKSTLAKIIMKLLHPESGKLIFSGLSISDLEGKKLLPYRRKVQMIFQDPFSSLNPKFTIQQVLAEPLKIHRLGNQYEIDNKVNEFIELVGLKKEDLKKFPHQFSGGQRQRICIARALIMEPEMIVCDEPVSALDVSIQAQILELLKSLQSKLNLTYLFITHDLRVVKYMAKEMIVLQKGKLVEKGTVKEVFSNPKTNYTKSLIDSIPGSI